MTNRRRFAIILVLASLFVFPFAWYYWSVDWCLRGISQLPNLRDEWKVDSPKLKKLVLSGELVSDPSLLKVEAYRSILFEGEIEISELQWQISKAIGSPMAAYSETKSLETKSRLPVAKLQVLVVRRSAFGPGYKTIIWGAGFIRKSKERSNFRFDVHFPNVSGEYLLIGQIAPHEGGNGMDEQSSMAPPVRHEDFLFARKIQVVPTVKKPTEKSQKIKLHP